MYPKNAASPEPIAIGAVIQISDGAVQTSGVTVRIKPIGVAEGDGGGTTSYSTDGIVLYTPTQAETNYTSFILIAKKSGCIPVAMTVVTTASSTTGTVLLAPVTHTSAVVPTVGSVTGNVGGNVVGSVASVTGAVGSVTGNVGGNVVGSVASVTAAVTVGTINANVITAASIAADAVTEIQSGLATPTNITAGTITTVTNLTNLPTIPTNWITASGIAADAITDAKVASDVTIASVTGAVGSVTGNVGGNVVGSVASVTGAVGSVTGNVGGNVVGSVASVTAAVTVGTINAGVITASAIATDAIGSDEISAAAVTKIQAGLATPTNITAATGITVSAIGANVITAASLATDAVTEIQNGLATPTNITAGTITTVTNVTTVNGLAANVITAASLATDAVTEIQSGIATASNLATVAGYLDTEIAAILAVMNKLDTTMVLDGAVYQFTANALELGPAGAGGDPWDDALPGAYAAGTAGYILGNLSTGAGVGARTVSATVTYLGSPFEGATVRITKGAESRVGTTDASGVTQPTWNVDDGTWTVAITGRDIEFAGATLVVDGNETPTYAVTPVIHAVSDVDKRTGFLYCYDENGDAESGVDVTITCHYAPSTGLALDSTVRAETSGATGLVEFTNMIVGARYSVKRGTGAAYSVLVASGTDPFELTSIVGQE
jgi:hypothetical protein